MAYSLEVIAPTACGVRQDFASALAFPQLRTRPIEIALAGARFLMASA